MVDTVMILIVALLSLNCVLQQTIAAGCKQARISVCCQHQNQKQACIALGRNCRWDSNANPKCQKKNDPNTDTVPENLVDCKERDNKIDCELWERKSNGIGSYMLYNTCLWEDMPINDNVHIAEQIRTRHQAESTAQFNTHIEGVNNDEIGKIKRFETLEIFNIHYQIEGYKYLQQSTANGGLGLNIQAILNDNTPSRVSHGHGTGATTDITMALPKYNRANRAGDKRVRVEKHAQLGNFAIKAFENIGKIDIDDPYDMDIDCTGTLISQKLVYTAAHCIMNSYDKKNNRGWGNDDDFLNLNGGLYKDITSFFFYPQYNGNEPNHNSGYGALKFFVPRGYVRSWIGHQDADRRLPDYDYAFVLLDLPKYVTEQGKTWADARNRFYGFSYTTPHYLRSALKVTAGYPSDLNNRDDGNLKRHPFNDAPITDNNGNKVRGGHGYFMYKSPLKINHVEELWVEDNQRKSTHGQSGAPLLGWHQGEMIIYGVLSQQNRRGKWWQKYTHQKGVKCTRITKIRYKMMEALVNEYH